MNHESPPYVINPAAPPFVQLFDMPRYDSYNSVVQHTAMMPSAMPMELLGQRYMHPHYNEHPQPNVVPAGRLGIPTGPRHSVKYLTCAFWVSGGCFKSEEECMYSHHDTGHYAQKPMRSGLAARKLRLMMLRT